MKVAVLVSGQPRFLRASGYRSIKEKVLDKYDCDVFCHFWWSPDGGTYDSAPWSGVVNLPISPTAESDIIELYNPKKTKWHLPVDPKSITKTYPRTTSPTTWVNLPCLYFSMQESYKLMVEYIKETGTKYDWVIRLRYDAILTSFPDLTKLPKGFLYDCDYSQFHNSLANNGLIMSPEISEIIMNMHDYMDEMYNLGSLFNDEQLITTLVISKKIPFTILSKDQFYIDLCRKDD